MPKRIQIKLVRVASSAHSFNLMRFAALVIIFSISTLCNYPIVVWSCDKIGYDDTVRDAWSSGVLMSVGEITVGVMTVGVMHSRTSGNGSCDGGVEG